MKFNKINTQHEEVILDIKYNYDGTKIAACSADHKIKVWEFNFHRSMWELVDCWKAHDAPVLQICWANPQSAPLIASCSMDRTIRLWEEEEVGQGMEQKSSVQKWVEKARLVESKDVISSIKFSPLSFGLKLASITTKGMVRIYEAFDPMDFSDWTLVFEFMSDGVCGASELDFELELLPPCHSASSYSYSSCSFSNNNNKDKDKDSNLVTTINELQPGLSFNFANNSSATIIGYRNNSQSNYDNPPKLNSHALRSTDHFILHNNNNNNNESTQSLVASSATNTATTTIDTNPMNNNNSDKNKDENSINTEVDDLFCIEWGKSRQLPMMVAVGSGQLNTVKIFCFINNQWKAYFELKDHNNIVMDISITPDFGRNYHLIATACKDKVIRIYKLYKHNANDNNINPYAINFIPNQSTLYHWKIILVAELTDHQTEVWGVQWDFRGLFLSSCGDDGTIIVWKAHDLNNWLPLKIISPVPKA